MDPTEERILERLREWYAFSERAKIDLAGGPEEFDAVMGDLIVACKVIKIVVNETTYYRRATVR